MYYGTAAFNSATVSGGDFVPYTATVTKVDGTVPEQPGESEEESESESESESETESEPEVEEYKVSAGTYEGTHTKVAMGSTIKYVCMLELKEDGTYVYGVKFVMGGNEYTSEEKGTYTVANNVLTLKTDAPMSSKDDAAENTATVTADNTFTLSRYISGMASNKEDVDYTLSDVKFVTGTYGGEYTNVSSSGKETDYVYTLTLNADGSYVYTSSFLMGGTTYTQTETGGYTAENGVLTLTGAGLKVTDPDGNVAMESSTPEEMTGTIDAEGKAATITRYVSYFAEMSGSKANLTLAYGYTPSLDTDSDDSTNNDSAPGLVSGAYAVDTSFAQMAAMLAPVVEINAEAMTFNVYKASDPATSRGSGTITYAEGVYTEVPVEPAAAE